MNIKNIKHNLRGAALLLLLTCTLTQSVQAYTHPGIPLTSADLADIKAKVQAGTQPWKAGYDALAADSHSQLSYVMQGPFANVSRNPHVNRNQWLNDMHAVWQLACMWHFTGNAAYAQKSRDILIAWANTQTSFTGNESNLDLGDFAYRYAGAASILRGTWSGWTAADTTAVKNLFANVYWPSSKANELAPGPANKGALTIVAGTCMAAFLDDTAKMNQVLLLFRTSASSGLPNTLPTGENGESARDQGHAYGMLLSQLMAAEVMWKQNIDVFSLWEDRLLACSEYFARKNLGLSAPFVPFGTTDWLYLSDTTVTWPHGRLGLNLAQGAYVLRKGKKAFYTIQRRDQLPQDSVTDFMFQKTADSSTAGTPTPITFPTAALVGTGLTNLDVGATPAGSGTFANNVWTVKGGGAEIWTHNADSFHFVYKQVSGDFSITAKVTGVQNTNAAAKAGVMIRDSLSATAARKAWVALNPGTQAEYFHHGWTEMWGGSNWEHNTRATSQSVWWVKAERIGDVISLYTSIDGTSWAAIGVGRYTGFTGTAYIGLVVCSKANGTLNTSTFSDVRITGGTGGVVTIPPAPYTAVVASPGNGQATIRWLSSPGATSYNIKRSTSSNGTYTTVGTQTNGGLTSFVNTGLTNGTTYYYKVSAVNSAGESPNSGFDSVTPAP